MEIGIGYFGDIEMNAQKTQAEAAHEVMQDILSQAKLADQLGLDVIAVGEHHRPDYAISSPHTFLAGLATVTERIKLMSAVNVLSSADPVALYQAYATIQAMSNGRAEIGIGRGSFTESFPVFGYDLSNYEVLFEEKFDLIQVLMKDEIVNWEGTMRAPLNNVGIYPRVKEDIPMWVAVGGTPSSVYRAAKAGLPLIVAIIGGQISQFKPLFDYYRSVYEQHGHPMDKMLVGIHSHTLLLPDEESKKAYFKKYAEQMNRIGRTRGWSAYQYVQFQHGMSEDGALFMGTKEEIKAKIEYVKELFGLDRFIAHMDVGAPDKVMLENTIKALAEVKEEMEG